MGKTSTSVKKKWNAANYDRLSITIPKGDKDLLKAALGEQSINSFINEVITEKIKATQ